MTTNVISSTNTSASRASQTASRRWLKWLPSVLFLGAAVLLLVSISAPYWGLVLQAPQYPGGLRMRVFVNNMTGDEDPRLDEVREIDGLNHYIGMKSLYEAAKFERSIALPAVFIMAVLLVVAAVWRRRWTWLLALPAFAFPVVFLADLGLWMAYYGQNLDPYAPLSSSIQPFTPPILGEGVIGQFKTIAYVDTGWYIIAAGSLLIAVALLIKLSGRLVQPKG
ncbi:MAG: cytochrome C [Chloroflexi bacterium]|nr:cytochrome C [Chloroflexota bacterium]